MFIYFDVESDVLYVRLAGRDAGPVARAELDAPSRLVEYDERDEVLGVHVLNVSLGVSLHGRPRATDIASGLDRLSSIRLAVAV